jgi:hypothetical protein
MPPHRFRMQRRPTNASKLSILLTTRSIRFNVQMLGATLAVVLNSKVRELKSQSQFGKFAKN